MNSKSLRISGTLDAITTEISKSEAIHIEDVHGRNTLTSVVYA